MNAKSYSPAGTEDKVQRISPQTLAHFTRHDYNHAIRFHISPGGWVGGMGVGGRRGSDNGVENPHPRLAHFTRKKVTPCAYIFKFARTKQSPHLLLRLIYFSVCLFILIEERDY